MLIALADGPGEFLAAVRQGALGYVLQEASASDVVSAIRIVAQGEGACTPRFINAVFDFVALGMPTHRVRVQLGLTRREQQLVPLIARGLTKKEIAMELRLSEQNVAADYRRQAVEACQMSTL